MAVLIKIPGAAAIVHQSVVNMIEWEQEIIRKAQHSAVMLLVSELLEKADAKK